MVSIVPLLYRSAGLAFFAYIFTVLPSTPESRSFGWHFQYLTIVGLALTMVTTALGVGSALRSGTMTVLCSKGWQFMLPMTLAAETVIALLYWALTLTSQDLMFYPDELVIPAWLDFGLHLFPAVFQLVSFVRVRPALSPSKRQVYCMLVVGVLYGAWMHFVHHMNGFWPYPFLALMSDMQRYGFVGFALGLLLSVYATIFYVTSWRVHMPKAKPQ
ncbi:hypothetical protein H4R34_006250 [Dimargaris verticillata]|uniref:FAR-17a/AIG1-like protein n=1 Tax=Dimargaris verticillata TaxID=2761393 RepID=A0A9W8E480_9FUNG|nr:hypothetical protein H4R34_006250 [Dimargaris verticillata]